MWHIRQVLTSCTIWHISLVPWCDILDRFWHPVQSDTFLPRDQRNVSDCTGCQNLSNMSHQGTREMCQIVQDVRTCLICHTKGPEKWGSDILYNLTHISGPLMWHIRQVLTSCTIWHISLVPWWDVRTCLICHIKGPEICVRLYRMSEPV
jgi:hypothetical protein